MLLASGVPIHIKYYAQSLSTCRETQEKILKFLEPWLVQHCASGIKAITHRASNPPYIRMAWGGQCVFAACMSTSSVDRQRGADVDVCLGDEVAFITPKILKTDIAVHSSRPHCAVLFCTTPLDNENVASVLLDAKDKETGEYLFDRSYVASACARCRANHTVDTCFHILDGIPDHLGGENKLQRAIMSDDEMDNELRAIITVSGEPAFPTHWIEGGKGCLLEQERVPLPDKVPCAFLGVDPSGLSLRTSDLAVSLVYFTEQHKAVVAGMMSLSTDSLVQMEEAFYAFLTKIRQTRAFRATCLVPLIEVNLKGTAQMIRNYMRPQHGPWFFPTFGSENDQVGPLTDINAKLDWVMNTRRLILDKLFRFSAPLLTLGGGGKEEVRVGTNDNAVFRMFFDQAKAYKFYRTPQGKLTANGKEGGRSKDDLYDAVLIAITHGTAFCQEGNVHRRKLDGYLKQLSLGFYAKEV